MFARKWQYRNPVGDPTVEPDFDHEDETVRQLCSEIASIGFIRAGTLYKSEGGYGNYINSLYYTDYWRSHPGRKG